MRFVLLLPLLTGCSLALDFDDIADLPCPCDVNHVCLLAANRCVPRGSVEDFKSCTKDTDPPGGDLLCRGNRICEDVNGFGPRCLPTCTPQSYGLPDASLAIQAQCEFGKTCWATDRGGVCSEGVCTTTPGSCGVNGDCVVFNGAGICFTVCEIARRNQDPCAGGQVCHPIGNSQTTGCIEPGPRLRRQACDLENLCQAEDESGRGMVCSGPAASSNPNTSCYPICTPADGTCAGVCVQARYGTDSLNMQPVFICEENT